MQIDAQEFAATYRNCSDDDIAALASQPDALTGVARAVLDAEIQRRCLSRGHIEKLHAHEVHRAARFDQLETIRRKKTALYLLTRNDPKGMIAFILIFLGLGVFVWLRSFFH